MSVSPQLEKSPVFSTSSRDEAQIPCFTSRGIPTFPSHLKRRPVSPIETSEEPRGSCCNSKGRRVPPQLEIRPDSPAPTKVETRVFPQNMMGSLTPLLQPLEKGHFPPQPYKRPETLFTTRDESEVTYPEIHVATEEES